jgi:hypothetical protein
VGGEGVGDDDDAGVFFGNAFGGLIGCHSLHVEAEGSKHPTCCMVIPSDPCHLAHFVEAHEGAWERARLLFEGGVGED